MNRDIVIPAGHHGSDCNTRLTLVKEREKEREIERVRPLPWFLLVTCSPDGNMESWLFSFSSIQCSLLSVICNKCPHHIFRELEIITG